MQSIDSIETYAYGISKDLLCNKKEIKRSKIIKKIQKCLTLNILQKRTQKNMIQISQKFLTRILIVQSCRSRKTNALLNLINNEPDLDKFIYMQKIHMKQNINY